jgi:hypothetical protein
MNMHYEPIDPWRWYRNPSGTEAEIAAVEQHFGVRLPCEYKRFLLWSDGGEGRIGAGRRFKDGYVSLWPTAEIIGLNADYDIGNETGLLIGVGSDGGGDCFAFDYRSSAAVPPVVEIGFADADVTAARIVSASFGDWFATGDGILTDLGDGEPFPPVVLEPRWLTSNVLDLARLIYDERAFDHLPILADALMDAGCDNDDILSHCRIEGPHVRGCWVVDLLLGKQ